MARIKYAPDVAPIIGEHNGNTFQDSRIGAVMLRGQTNDRNRYPWQNARKMNITHANGHWRNLTPTEQTAWSNFAAAFPQPSHRNPAVFLSGYECFIKRQSYLFLAYGNQADFLTAPSLSETLPVNFTPSLYKVGPDLYFKLVFDTFGQTVDFHVFCSVVGYPSKVYQRSQPRYMGVLSNELKKEITNGNLYNGYCERDSRLFAPAGWRFPTYTEYTAFANAFGGVYVAGGHMKSIVSGAWLAPNTGGDNSSGFNVYGSGGRTSANFQAINVQTMLFYQNFGAVASAVAMRYDTAVLTIFATQPLVNGRSIRLVKDDTTIVDSMTGNDGFIYPTITINGRSWMAVNSIETKFRNGDDIPFVTSQATWGALTSSAWCQYNNNPSNSNSPLPNVINISEQYKNMFGIVPESGQCLQIRVVPVSRSNGQFFTELRQNLIIE